MVYSVSKHLIKSVWDMNRVFDSEISLLWACNKKCYIHSITSIRERDLETFCLYPITPRVSKRRSTSQLPGSRGDDTLVI